MATTHFEPESTSILLDFKSYFHTIHGRCFLFVFFLLLLRDFLFTVFSLLLFTVFFCCFFFLL